MQNYSSALSSESRVLIREELSERIQYNVKDLLENVLQIGDVSSKLVDNCVRRLRHEYASDFAALERVSQTRKSKEDGMYIPLFEIFRAIEETSREYKRKYNRHFVTGHTRQVDEEGMPRPSLIPDFLLIETPNPSKSSAPLTDIPMQDDQIIPVQVKARQICGFIEVKSNEAKNRPIPASEDAPPKEVTLQVADYARLVFTGRPHHLFVIGILVYGMRFCVAYFDRAGALFSKEYHLKDNLDVLVRVIRRLTCDMSANQLGHNPNVTLIEGHTYYQDSYPHFRIRLGGVDNRVWLTDGPIRWSSLSLFGRGSSVWNAGSLNTTNGKKGHTVILKIAWRNECRMSEADIYSAIGRHQNIARCIGGDDACFPASDEGLAVPLKVNELRKRIIGGIPEVKPRLNVILHLITLYDVGRPLWEYEDELELIHGIRAIIGGLWYLSEDRKILHRDISPGNVYLRDGLLVDPSARGFIADVELADVPLPETTFVARGVPDSATLSTFEQVAVPPKSEAGPMMTGTAQFMATEVLRGVMANRKVVRTVHHDFESLLFVVIYALYKKTLSKDIPLKREIAAEFSHYFGGHTVLGILDKRSALYSEDGLAKLIEAVSKSIAMKYLVESIKILIRNQNSTATYSKEVLESADDLDIPRMEESRSVPIAFILLDKVLAGAEKIIINQKQPSRS